MGYLYILLICSTCCLAVISVSASAACSENPSCYGNYANGHLNELLEKGERKLFQNFPPKLATDEDETDRLLKRVLDEIKLFSEIRQFTWWNDDAGNRATDTPDPAKATTTPPMTTTPTMTTTSQTTTQIQINTKLPGFNLPKWWKNLWGTRRG